MQRWQRKVRQVAVLCALCGALAGAYLVRAHVKPRVTMEFHPSGLTAIKFNGTNFLDFGEFRVVRATMRQPLGATVTADLNSRVTVDAAAQTITRKFRWGAVSTQYETEGNRLLIKVTTKNTSSDTIDGVVYEPLGLIFPSKVLEYDGSSPLLGHNVGNPTVVGLSYKDGVIVLVNEDVRKPLIIGFPWALDRPANTIFPLRIVTGRDSMLPDMLPYIQRPIKPGEADVFTLSLRFGSHGSSAVTLADDVLKKFAAVFPTELKWKDRRPIGTVTLATAGLNSPTNPRGWFQDRKLDVTTEEGRADFHRRLLQVAESTINVLRDMNAQGMITWDIEGQEHAAAIYAGDPRAYATLAPEMSQVADEYFRTVRDAGFRVGVCVRPQELVIDKAHNNVFERETQDPKQVLMQKIAWAKQHWGASLFYIDFNGDPSRPLDADIVNDVAKAFPDVLLIPEHKNLRYYAFSAPYFSLGQGAALTPGAVKAVYPDAFSVVNTAEAQVSKHRDDLMAAVRQGDILMYRTWYDDPANAEVKTLYY